MYNKHMSPHSIVCCFIQVKAQLPPQPPKATDFVDPITFKTGPLARAKLREILKEQHIAVPTRKRRKKAAAVSGEKAGEKRLASDMEDTEELRKPKKKS